MKMQITEHVHALKMPFQLRAATGIFAEKICLIDSGVATLLT
jgi:hypothetical protein